MPGCVVVWNKNGCDTESVNQKGNGKAVLRIYDMEEGNEAGRIRLPVLSVYH